MALRLRRGTDAERQLITPAEGELIYTTDTKTVYIGDGTTPGGIVISGQLGLDDLTDVDLSTPPTLGQVLSWDGTKFVPSTVAGVGPEALSVFDLNDVFKVTDPDPGDLLIYDGINFTPQKIQRIEGTDSSVMVDTASNTFTGRFVGDGSGLTNLPGISPETISIFTLNDVFKVTDPDPGDLLIYDGINFTPRKIDQIEGADSTIIVDTVTNTFTGNFVGSVLSNNSTLMVDSINSIIPASVIDGVLNNDVIGSIFGLDSTTLVDSISSSIVGRIDNLETVTEALVINNNIDSPDGDPITVFGVTQGINGPAFTYRATRTSLTSPSAVQPGDTILDIVSTGNDGDNLDTPAAVIKLGVDKYTSVSSGIVPGRIAFITYNDSGTTSINNVLVFNRLGNLGIGTDNPSEKLDIRGNGVFAGTVTAASFNGSFVTDDSTTIIDGTNNSFVISNVDIIGSTGNAPLNTGTVDSWLEVSVNGATKYIPLYV